MRSGLYAAPKVDVSVGFTGTHHGMSRRQKDNLWILLIGLKAKGYRWFHHGDCVGADAEACQMAWELCYLIAQHPPVKDVKRAFTLYHYQYPEDEYLARDRGIVNQSSLLLAAPFEAEEQQRSGTWYTYRYARKIWRPVYLLKP